MSNAPPPNSGRFFYAFVSQARSRAATDPFDDDGDLDLSASLWFQTLDKILSAKGAACRSDPNTASAAAVRGGVGVAGDRGGLAGRGRAATRAATAATAGGELPQTAAVMGGVLDALLQRTLSSMAGGSICMSVLCLCASVFESTLCPQR